MKRGLIIFLLVVFCFLPKGFGQAPKVSDKLLKGPTSRTNTNYQEFEQVDNREGVITNTNMITDLRVLLQELEENQFVTNFSISGTNFLSNIDFYEKISLKVSFEFDKKINLKEEPFFLPFERRYEIIFLVSIPTTYMITKFLMEQVSFYNYKDNTRSLNTQQWAFVIASSILIPFIIATEDYIRYKEFVEKKLRF